MSGDILARLSRQYKGQKGTGYFKRFAEDFKVSECVNIELTGSGEHVWLLIEKREQNTQFVAEQLARFAGIRKFDVGYSGLKDRQSVSTQWFSCYMGNRPEPSWDSWLLEGVRIVKVIRHAKKLRRGEHDGNQFEIRLRDCQDIELIKCGLDYVKGEGFPNYFGPQRFGRSGYNVMGAFAYFEGRTRASKSQRGFFISATRSFLFNRVLSDALSHELADLEDTISLFGDSPADTSLSWDKEGAERLSLAETSVLDQYTVLHKGLRDNRVAMDRRAARAYAEDLSYHVEGDDLLVSFTLDKGVFATSLFRECVRFE